MDCQSNTMVKRIFQFKIQLMRIRPPIWRRVLVASDATLGDLHDVIQRSFGWLDYHLHQFFVNGIVYGAPNAQFDWTDLEDESDCELNVIFRRVKDHIRYEYDFGDSWQHKITLEKFLDFDEKQKLPFCLKAVRACPPEDCGGCYGYESMLEIIANSNHPEYENMTRWLSGRFTNAEYVDLNEINDRLS